MNQPQRDFFAAIFKEVLWNRLFGLLYEVFNEKVHRYVEQSSQHQKIAAKDKMVEVFEFIKQKTADQVKAFQDSMPDCIFNMSFCAPYNKNSTFYYRQIIEYAKQHDYYVNLALDKCWVQIVINIGHKKVYRLIISLHHFGYNDGTFAIGAFLSKRISIANTTNSGSYADTPLGVPPLTFSVEKDLDSLKQSISEQIESSIVATFAFIANEL